MIRLGISNIAWGPKFDTEMFEFLAEAGIEGLEPAPGLLPSELSFSQMRALVEKSGLRVFGLHSLLFERPELRIANPDHHEELLTYLGRLAQACAELGGKTLVFGSPNSRATEGKDPKNARAHMVDFFRRLGDVGAAADVFFLIEPLPRDELFRSSADGIRLVRDVDHPHFQLHLDIRTMTALNEPPEESVKQQSPYLMHVHSGGPNLGVLGENDGIPHRKIADALRANRYEGWVSLEMRRDSDVPNYSVLEKAIRYARSHYCS